MRVELMACERVLLEEIQSGKFTRDSVALTYAMSICSSERDSIDWAKVNAAIVERWSPSALEYIKERAWKLIDERGQRG